jgi:hypothetical protein
VSRSPYDRAVPDRPAPRSSAPLSALPSTGARLLAFASILVGGLAGGLIGYGFVDVSGGDSTASALGALVGAVVAAAGTAVIAVLVLRAMGEWKQLDQ